MRAYGPFSDEQLFVYDDDNTLDLDQFQIYDASKSEFIGFDDLQVIYDKGNKGNFNRIFFGGIATIEDLSMLCQQGFDTLYNAVLERHPSITPIGFERSCSEGEVKVELYCQLKNMPVAYLTERPENSILVYSNNLTNFRSQRRYCVRTFHIKCFSRSEQTLQFAMVEKFVMDASKAKFPKKTPRANRDVHWLVDEYIKLYNKVFPRRGRPRLHRAVVYDYFAVYAEALYEVFDHKIFTMNTPKWKVWLAESKEYKKKAEAEGSEWGSVPLGRLQALPEKDGSEGDDEEEDGVEGDVNMTVIDDVADRIDDPLAYRDRPETSESSSDEEDVPYAMDVTVRALMQRRFHKRMPLPAWYWECDVDPDCTFVINLNRAERKADAPYMAKLRDIEKRFLVEGSWRLIDPKVKRIWQKICQAHWEEHMQEAGLWVDHTNKRIVLRQINEN